MYQDNYNERCGCKKCGKCECQMKCECCKNKEKCCNMKQEPCWQNMQKPYDSCSCNN